MTSPGQAWARQSSSGVRLDLRVTPRAPRNGFAGVRDGRLLVRVTAPPVDAAANDAVVSLIAEGLGVPKRAVVIVIGAQSRLKTVVVAGVDAAIAIQKLSPR